MNSLEIRKKFFDFFMHHNHTKVSSSSLIPAQDPTLLFANAGMNQFKDVFLAKEKRSYTRAVTIQKCVRAGGKHNDLENVGFTKRHLTFFEMMGNFSFGDYFKKEAIQFAWDFLTNHMGFSKETFHATVYKKDDEAYAIWKDQIGLPESRIHRLGEADNFWQMGDTGPCGPCSEILIDRGSDMGCKQPHCAPGCSCDRFLEVWNLVFMQFNRQADGTDIPLSQVGVDTGMGLERLCVIVQDKDSVYQTDLFVPIIQEIERLTGVNYQAQSPEQKASFHVLADHIRSSTFLIADGCSPSNEGRGYVLRKIIRRAALFSKKLTDKVIFPNLSKVVIKQMGHIYPELIAAQDMIHALLTSEVEKFSANLTQGQVLLEGIFSSSTNKIITGEQAFKLYDTYGFPLELTQLIAQEKGFTVDLSGFEKAMEKQRNQSGKKTEQQQQISLSASIKTIFTGYQELQTQSSIIGIVCDNQLTDKASAGQECIIFTKESPFYVECGGQISDTATVEIHNKIVPVKHLQKIDNAIGITIDLPIDIKVGDAILQKVDAAARSATMKNHTATHLLQAALMQIFGKQVKQAGSLVAPGYLRFDCMYHETITPQQIKAIEDMVNAKIQENIPVVIEQTTYKQAVDKGVIAFFGDKYNPENVRVVAVPGFSAELCGGTHVKATGDIGCFKITEITALSAGQRRIVAITGPEAVNRFQKDFAIVKNLSQEFKVQDHQLIDSINKLKEAYKHALNENRVLQTRALHNQIPQLLQNMESINGLDVLIYQFDNLSGQQLKEIAQTMLKKKPGFYFLLTPSAQGVNFYAEQSSNLAGISFSDLKKMLEEHGLKSGGKEHFLQGGGTIKDVQAFLKMLKDWTSKNKK